jgi:hypothetical protein
MKRIRLAQLRGWFYVYGDALALAAIVALLAAFAMALRRG